MSCVQDLNFNRRITKADATYSLFNNYNGSISVADDICGFSEADLYKRFSVNVTVSSQLLSGRCTDLPSIDEEVEECLSGDLVIVNGILVSIGEGFEISEKTVDLSFDTYFNHLNRKAVNTEPFTAQTVKDVLEDVCQIYCGIPASLVDFDDAPTGLYVWGPLDGNNVLEELKMIAQAGYCHLFVQTNGKLTAEPWLACEDAEIDLPCTVVKSANKVSTYDPPPTVIRVRGAELDTLDCGEVNFTDTKTSSESGRSGYESAGGGGTKCVYTGLSQKDADARYNNLLGSKEDLKNASVFTEGLSLRKIAQISNGQYEFSVTDADAWLGKGSQVFYGNIHGQRRRDAAKDRAKSRRQSKKSVVPPARTVGSLRDYISGRPPIDAPPAFGSGVKGGLGHNDDDYTAKEPSRSQIEVVVYDPDLVAIYGVREEQIENKYVTCKETLFNIGIRRFQQWRMEQNTWEVDIIPMPCLRINQMVSFTPPKTADCAEHDPVTGVISGISYSWDAATSATTQKLTVMSTDSLCQVEYGSGNLIRNWCGADGTGDWSSSGTSANNLGHVQDEMLYLHTEGIAGYAYVYLTQLCMEVGAEYTIVFYADFIEGAAPFLTFTVTDGTIPVASSPIIGGSGTFSVTFTATQNWHNFVWAIASVGVPNFWRIYDISLYRTKVG